MLEQFREELDDTLCVGQRRPEDKDERVLLFVKMRPGHKFTDDLVRRIKEAIRKDLSARHVPSYVFEISDIPVRVVPLHTTHSNVLTKLVSVYCKREEDRDRGETNCFWIESEAKRDCRESGVSATILQVPPPGEPNCRCEGKTVMIQPSLCIIRRYIRRASLLIVGWTWLPKGSDIVW